MNLKCSSLFLYTYCQVFTYIDNCIIYYLFRILSNICNSMDKILMSVNFKYSIQFYNNNNNNLF